MRNYILTETSPFNKNKTPKKLIIEAGRVSTGTARLFVGDITASSPGDKEALFEPSNSKVYRHPTFFPMPEEVKNL